AFPFDPSESVDTDGDGIGDVADSDDDDDGTPDEADAFPLDPACASASDSDCEVCFLSAIRRFDNVFADASGVLYLAVRADKAVYRWDTNTAAVLPTWKLGAAVPSDSVVLSAAYVASHERLYFGYDHGAITYVDVPGGVEQPLAAVPTAVR